MKTIALMLAAGLAAAPARAQDPRPAEAQDARLAEAQDHYEAGHYAEAFVRFARLADDGHCEAARIARQMARYGRTLFAVPFDVPAARLQSWQRPAGCPVPLASR